MNASAERDIDRWFAHYSADHQNRGNQRIHVVAVPLILWSVVALLWCDAGAGHLVPPQNPGAALAMFLAWSFYWRASRSLGLGMLAWFVLLAWITRWLHARLGTQSLLCGSRSACSWSRGSRSSSATPSCSKAASRFPHRPQVPADRPGLGAGGEAVSQLGIGGDAVGSASFGRDFIPVMSVAPEAALLQNRIEHPAVGADARRRKSRCAARHRTHGSSRMRCPRRQTIRTTTRLQRPRAATNNGEGSSSSFAPADGAG